MTKRKTAAKPEVKKPEAAKPEVKKPEAAKPEVKKPEAVKPEVKKPQPKKAVVEFQKVSAITSLSPLLLITNGKEQVKGYAQRYDVAVNAHHLKAKKGEVVYISETGDYLKEVTATEVIK